MPNGDLQRSRAISDVQYQDHILQAVSRTFALTIPQLPPPLSCAVGNAYLLCRIADTIEDEPALSPEQKKRLTRGFIDVVTGKCDAEPFSGELSPLLSPETSAAERDLILNAPRVIRVTRSFSPTQQAALLRCVTIMANGMAYFQSNKNRNGLNDLGELNSYCYHVAGVVGEMLTELYCEYSESINEITKRCFRLPCRSDRHCK